MQMTKSQAILVAKLVEQLRPEWNFHGTMAALAKAIDGHDAFDVAIAAITAAADPDAKTPGVIPTDGHWWPTWKPSTQAANAYATRARLENNRSQQVIAAIRRDDANRDPVAGHLGYLEASAALEATRTEESQ